MAGNDRQERLEQGPAIILVEPQLGENIGMVARAMANFGLTELRLVNPRDGWPSDKARAAASRAAGPNFSTDNLLRLGAISLAVQPQPNICAPRCPMGPSNRKAA